MAISINRIAKYDNYSSLIKRDYIGSNKNKNKNNKLLKRKFYGSKTRPLIFEDWSVIFL